MGNLRRRLSLLILILMLVTTLMPAISLASDTSLKSASTENPEPDWDAAPPQGTIWYRGG
jgi:hypothetical protein